MSEPQRSFCGIPITGNVYRPGTAPQLTQAQYENLVRPLLEDPKVVRFGWNQYTPYYNDGETCYFRVGALWMQTINPDGTDPAQSWDDDRARGLPYSKHSTLGSHVHNQEQREDVTPGYEATAFYAEKLSTAMYGGALDHVLMNLFGDHAEVTVEKTGITVGQYDHD